MTSWLRTNGLLMSSLKYAGFMICGCTYRNALPSSSLTGPTKSTDKALFNSSTNNCAGIEDRVSAVRVVSKREECKFDICMAKAINRGYSQI